MTPSLSEIPLVSVILINFRGVDDTIEAVRNVLLCDWPPDCLEVVVVENGSGDDSATRLEEEVGDSIHLVVSPENLGFAAGCNLGVKASSGSVIAFLNNDARPDLHWIRSAVETFDRSASVGAVASRVLDWEGDRVDYIGSAMTWFGMGYKPFASEPVPARAGIPESVLFGTGAAMLVRRDVFNELDGFDERFFMFFEDVDFGWRLNLLGYTFAYVPESLAYHKHHASMKSYGSFKEQYLLERNALFTLYKNVEESRLATLLTGAIALSIRRAISESGLNSGAFDLRAGGSDLPNEEVPRSALSSTYAIDQFVESLPSLSRDRAVVQASRRVSDTRLMRLFGESDTPVRDDDNFVRGYENIVTTFDVTSAPSSTRILVITGDPIGAKVAGPAIRAWSIAEALASDHEVRLLSLSAVEREAAAFDVIAVRPGDDRSFDQHEKWSDVIIFQGHAMAMFRSLRTTAKIVVVDIYDPMHLEQLEQARGLPPEVWDHNVSDATLVLNEQLARGDFFVCASERQRHFYLGQLAALGRISPATYVGDPDLSGLISVVPFGLSRTAPQHERASLKGVLAGISSEDKVILWSGGLYNWFDPSTLINAMAILARSRPSVRLFFQGTRHPNPDVPEMAIVATSRMLARQLGLLDSTVFFNDSWVDYSDRQNYLTEADAGVSTHHAHIETTFSFRTRILDYLWAGLPMVVTDGDVFADLVRKENLGLVVPAEDPAALAEALERVLFDEESRSEMMKNITRVRERFYWDVVLEPLTNFMREPRRARDMTTGRSSLAQRVPDLRRRRKAGVRNDLRLAALYFRNGGALVVARKIRARLLRRRGR